MNNPLKTPAALHLGVLMVRVSLGATFLLYGIEKLTRTKIQPFVAANTKFLPEFMPKPIGQTYLYFVPFVEVIVGLCLILGLLTRTTAVITALMLVSYIIAVTGVFAGRDPMHLAPNVAYLGMALLLVASGAGRFSLDYKLFGQRG